MCLPCLNFGCNVKTNLYKVRLCLCSGLERSTTQAAEITSCCLQKKQRLVLPLVDNTDYDMYFPFVHTIHPLFYCWFECVLAKNLTHCWHSTKSILCTLDTRVGNHIILVSLDFGPNHTVIALLCFHLPSGRASVWWTHYMAMYTHWLFPCPISGFILRCHTDNTAIYSLIFLIWKYLKKVLSLLPVFA